MTTSDPSDVRADEAPSGAPPGAVSGPAPGTASGPESGTPTPPARGAAIASTADLVAAREARGWSASDVAAKLGMSSRQIEAIERGDWGALPGQAFVRGAIRAYGKALAADVAPLVATVGAPGATPELRPAASLEAPMPRRGALGFDSGGSGSRLTWILLGVLGVIAIATYFGRGPEWSRLAEQGLGAGGGSGRTVEPVVVTPPPVSSDQGSRTAASPAAAAPPPASSAPAAPTAASASMPGAVPAQPAATQAPSAAVAAPSSPTAPVAGAATGAAEAGSPASAAAGAADGGATLRFRFERESWVEVRDADGKLLLSGLQPADSVREIAGRRPYRLVIGNAEHVRLEHDGRQVELGAIARRNVARLKID